MIEVEVHSSLRNFLREQEQPTWPHHLTMARLVARALRLGKSALIQTGTSVGQYCLSYLTPILLSDISVILVAPQSIQKHLLEVEIPRLQRWFQTNKLVYTESDWLAGRSLRGLTLISPEVWLADRLSDQRQLLPNTLTIIDLADELEDWTRDRLTITLATEDWNELIATAPHHRESILRVRTKLTETILERPINPYECYLLEKLEQKSIESLLRKLAQEKLLNQKMTQFWQQWQEEDPIIWTSRSKTKQEFTLHVAPASIAEYLQPIWQQQPVVLIGSFLDRENSALTYRQKIGLEEILCLKFSPNRQSEHIQLYLPDRLPMPNTPEFQGALIEQIRTLIEMSSKQSQPIVLLVGDVPLKAQVGATMAAEFGSRVQVENPELTDNGILVCGWEFWRYFTQQIYLGNLATEQFPLPQLLVIATLPLPSLENPLVAARVAYYKRRRQDWFRLYLLPTALREIQRAVLPIRQSQGMVALLDNRVNYRSYGNIVLTALEPCARINYLDRSWFDLV